MIQTGSTAGATVIHTTKFVDQLYTSPSSALDSLPTTHLDQLTGKDPPTTTAKNEDAVTSRLTTPKMEERGTTGQSPNEFTPSSALKLMASPHVTTERNAYGEVTTERSAYGEVTTENNSVAKETNVTFTVVSGIVLILLYINLLVDRGYETTFTKRTLCTVRLILLPNSATP